MSGPVAKLRGDLIEDNRNEAQIVEWTAKHNRYAVLQARQEFAAAGGPTISVRAVLGSPDDRMRWLKHLWAGLPLYVRRSVRSTATSFGSDGSTARKASSFTCCKRSGARLLVDINLDELRAAHHSATAADLERGGLPAPWCRTATGHSCSRDRDVYSGHQRIPRRRLSRAAARRRDRRRGRGRALPPDQARRGVPA